MTPISELSIESSTFALLQEWLSGYFDGGVHNVGMNVSVPFPNAAILFQQSSAPQPLNGIAITCVWPTPSKPMRDWDTVDGTVQELMRVTVELLFFVRAQGETTADGDHKRQCMRACELLFGLLQNTKTTLPLSENGIHHLRPMPPRLISEGSFSKKPDLSYALRMIQCHMRLRCFILSQGEPAGRKQDWPASL